MNKAPSLKKLINQSITRQNLPELLKYLTLKISDIPTLPPEVITVDKKTIGTLGNIVMIAGKPKSGKSILNSVLAASALSGREVLNCKVAMPSTKPKVLYIDTEQARTHCHTVIERIYAMAELSKKDNENLSFCVLRELSPERRVEFIDSYLEMDDSIGLVIIDGVRDLLNDINNIFEANSVVSRLMEWTSTYNITVVGVIHLNKADENTRGHLGTELNNKAETVVHIAKVTNSATLRFEISCNMSRGESFDPYVIYIDSNHLPQIDLHYKTMKKKKTAFASISVEQHRNALEAAFSQGDIHSHKNLVLSLQKHYADIGFDRGRTWIIALQKQLEKKEVLSETTKGVYRYTPENVDKLQDLADENEAEKNQFTEPV